MADEGGLLRWGGHQFVDLLTLDPMGRFDADVHEFKSHFPYYNLLWYDGHGRTQDAAVIWSLTRDDEDPASR